MSKMLEVGGIVPHSPIRSIADILERYRNELLNERVANQLARELYLVTGVHVVVVQVIPTVSLVESASRRLIEGLVGIRPDRSLRVMMAGEWDSWPAYSRAAFILLGRS